MSTDLDSQQEVSDSEASKQSDQRGQSIDKKSDDVADSPAQERQNPNASSELIVLSPHYDEKHHGLYVEKLEQAVRNPKVRNIALTGGYGTGKSSIIQGLIERIRSSEEDAETNKSHNIQRLIEKIRPSKNPKKIRPIIISLPTIQVANESDPENDRTDRIQREIVKPAPIPKRYTKNARFSISQDYTCHSSSESNRMFHRSCIFDFYFLVFI